MPPVWLIGGRLPTHIWPLLHCNLHQNPSLWKLFSNHQHWTPNQTNPHKLYINTYANDEAFLLSSQLWGAYKFALHMHQYKGTRNQDFCDPKIPFELVNKILTLVKQVCPKKYTISPFTKIPKYFQSTNEKAPSLYSIIKREMRGQLLNTEQNKVKLPNDPPPPPPSHLDRFFSMWD